MTFHFKKNINIGLTLIGKTEGPPSTRWWGGVCALRGVAHGIHQGSALLLIFFPHLDTAKSPRWGKLDAAGVDYSLQSAQSTVYAKIQLASEFQFKVSINSCKSPSKESASQTPPTPSQPGTRCPPRSTQMLLSFHLPQAQENKRGGKK